MYTLFLILIILAAVLMIGIVLIQESKGGGLASNFSSSNQIMGVRKTTDFIEKATWGLAIAMVVLRFAERNGECYRGSTDQPEQSAWFRCRTEGCPSCSEGCPSSEGCSGSAGCSSSARRSRTGSSCKKLKSCKKNT